MVLSLNCNGIRAFDYIRMPLPLELRRLCNDLTWCYNIVFGPTVLKFDDFFEWNLATLHQRKFTHRSRDVFFSERVINVWNQLPESTDLRSLSLFMRNVHGIELSHYFLL